MDGIYDFLIQDLNGPEAAAGGLGLEGKSGWSLGWYKEKSEKIDFDDFPDQRIEGDRFILGYRWR